MSDETTTLPLEDGAGEPDIAHWDTRVDLDALDADQIAELPFERAYAALDEVVRRLESGDLDLEASITLYDRGVALARRCGALLETAELRVQQVDADGRTTGDLEV